MKENKLCIPGLHTARMKMENIFSGVRYHIHYIPIYSPSPSGYTTKYATKHIWIELAQIMYSMIFTDI